MNNTEYEPWSEGALSMEPLSRFLALGKTKIYKLMALGELEYAECGSRRLIARRSAVEFLRRLAQQRQEARQ